VDATFPRRAKEAGGGVLVGGTNYGQGSSREHAALAPMCLGVRAVLAKSFARIHRANLINFGILPLLIDPPSGYDAIAPGDRILIGDVKGQLGRGTAVQVRNVTKGAAIAARHDLTPRERDVLLAGGMLNWTKEQAAA
jgi:aconitate hydratase